MMLNLHLLLKQRLREADLEFDNDELDNTPVLNDILIDYKMEENSKYLIFKGFEGIRRFLYIPSDIDITGQEFFLYDKIKSEIIGHYDPYTDDVNYYDEFISSEASSFLGSFAKNFYWINSEDIVYENDKYAIVYYSEFIEGFEGFTLIDPDNFYIVDKDSQVVMGQIENPSKNVYYFVTETPQDLKSFINTYKSLSENYLSKLYDEDQAERNEYNDNYYQVYKDPKIASVKYAKDKKRKTDDIFGDLPRLKKAKEYIMKNIAEIQESTDEINKAWLLVQHMDFDVEFQEWFIKFLNPKSEEYKYLYDRIQVNLGKPQKYGTQNNV